MAGGQVMRLSGKWLIVDPYGNEALATASKEEVIAYLKNLTDHEINIVNFTVTHDGVLVEELTK